MNTFLPRLLVTALTVGLMSVAYIPSAHADQVHMKNALAALQNARAELEVAEHDKGGHRADAIRAVDRAIEQTRAGIAAGY